jgi:hypothetical protein
VHIITASQERCILSAAVRPHTPNPRSTNKQVARPVRERRRALVSHYLGVRPSEQDNHSGHRPDHLERPARYRAGAG